MGAVGGNAPLRLSKIEAWYQMMRTAPRSATLGGCRLIAKGTDLTVIREFGRMNALRAHMVQPGKPPYGTAASS